VEGLLILLAWVGVFAPMAMGAVGSSIGCTRAGQAACGAMLSTESGYGKYIGVSAMPASQTIYGIVVTLTLSRVVSDTTSMLGVFGIGIMAGLVQMVSAQYQGYCCASAISVSKDKPEVFGISLAPAAMVEGFAVFALVFALVLIGMLPKGA
jgi:V/A-type H+/Na+-transporting ATPase subunit K